MVAINFPDSPTNGQEHSGYVWDATNNVWNRLPTLPALDLVNFSAVAPSNPQDGQFWFDTTAGKMYVYYNDGSSAQWVSTLGGLVGQTGTEGQQLIHNGTEWVAYDGGSRNLLYNGAMQVAQRGTSATGLGNNDAGYYTADRWEFVESGVPTYEFTQTVENDAPSGSGFAKSLKMECTTAESPVASSSLGTIQQILEGQDLQGIKKGTSSAESLTLSFWAKSNVTGTYTVELEDVDNTRLISATYSVVSSATWEKKTIIFAGDTTGVLDNDNGGSFRVRFNLVAGTDFTSGTLQTSWGARVNADRAVGQTNLAASTSNYWQVTGVQLEAGEVATPFEHKPFGVELAECQRYYQLIAKGNNASIGNATAYRSYQLFSVVHFPVTMRVATPSLVQTTGTDYYRVFGNNTNDGFDEFDSFIRGSFSHGELFAATGFTVVQGYSYWIRTNNSASYLALDAEL